MNIKQKAVATLAAATIALASGNPAVAEDAYIENSLGNQYFNTGHFVGPHTRIEANIQLLEVKGQIRPFGVAGGTNADHPYCELYLGQAVSGGPWVWSYIASKTDYSSQAYNAKEQDAIYDAKDCEADLERHTIVLDLNSSPKRFEVWTGSTKVVSKDLANVSAGTQTYPLGIFALCRNASGMFSSAQTTYNNPAKMRLYSFRIYESGTLAKEFLPHVKGGVAGLKETISGQFHTGENARSCVAGGDVTVENDDPYVFFPDNDVMQSSAVSGKSQYFSTGYTFTPNSRLELDYALLTPDWTTSSLWANESHVFYAYGKNTNGSNSMVYLMPYGNSAVGCYYYKVGEQEGDITYAGVDYGYNVRRKVSASANQILMETAGYTNFNITSTKPVTANLTLQPVLLGLRGGSFAACPFKIYGLKIYETANGVESLVRDYVPTVSNSVSLLVDRLHSGANGKPSVQGSSTRDVVFEYGGDTGDDVGAGEAYLDFDMVKGHGIDTEYVITKDSCIEVDLAVWNANVATQPRCATASGFACTLRTMAENTAIVSMTTAMATAWSGAQSRSAMDASSSSSMGRTTTRRAGSKERRSGRPTIWRAAAADTYPPRPARRRSGSDPTGATGTAQRACDYTTSKSTSQAFLTETTCRASMRARQGCTSFARDGSSRSRAARCVALR